jgi:hypothetical protein
VGKLRFGGDYIGTWQFPAALRQGNFAMNCGTTFDKLKKPEIQSDSSGHYSALQLQLATTTRDNNIQWRMKYVAEVY